MTKDEAPNLTRAAALAICKSRTCEGWKCCQWPASAARRVKTCNALSGAYDDAARGSLEATASWLAARWGDDHPGAIAIRQELRR